ncbi:MAG TPA: Trp family transcriptional regulator [Candidatus Paceibacterota bacterium]|nr:Trp family transcriptional regulator [Verrucomicrobiota bacterium]HRY49834.1 Trp family transcriptional regulator [Candidatus Paceibacterota bacterium]
MDRIVDIARVFAATRNPRTVEHLLRALLTESEARKLSLRWDIVRFLSEGESQRVIARRLGVSLCKITRGARELKKRGSTLKRLFAQPASSSERTS